MEKRKRNDDEDEGVIKKPKVNKPPTKLSDLDEDSLVKIFTFLSIDDLINIVEYDTYFTDAARHVVKTKNVKEHLTVTTDFDPELDNQNRSEKLLNFFGGVITKLIVNYHDDFHRFDKVIDDMIITKCRDTLQEIEFKNANYFTMYGIQQSFKSVQVVSFVRGSFSRLISDFSKWFPVAHTLNIRMQKHNKYFDRIQIRNYPVLEHFGIARQTLDEDIHEPIFEKIIEMNPQLKSLTNIFEMYPEDDEDQDWGLEERIAEFEAKETYINANLPNLQNLRLVFIGDIYMRGNIIKKHFNHLKNLAIETNNSENLKNIHISTDEINSLTLCTFYLDENCLKFIRDHENVKYLALFGNWTNDIDDFFKLFSTLPNLEEMQLPSRIFKPLQPKQFVGVLTTCKMLNRITILTALNGLQKIQNSFMASSTASHWKLSISQRSMDIGGIHYAQIIFEKKL